MIALHMSVLQPDLISRQVLVGGSPALGSSEYYRKGLCETFHTEDWRYPPSKWRYIWNEPVNAIGLMWIHKQTNWYKLLADAWPMWVSSVSITSQQYKTIAADTLVLTGGADKLVHKNEALELANLIPSASFKPLIEEDHMFPVDKPWLIVEHALPFLR